MNNPTDKNGNKLSDFLMLIVARIILIIGIFITIGSGATVYVLFKESLADGFLTAIRSIAFPFVVFVCGLFLSITSAWIESVAKNKLFK